MSLEKKLKLKNNEKIVNIIRRFGLTFFWQFVLVAILLVVPFFFMFWLFAHSWWGMSLFVLFLAIGLIVLARILFLWRKNVLLLTTHRLVDVDQIGFFEAVVSDIPYDQIEDVHGRVRGVWQTLFNYGNVVIQTGNGKVQVIVDRVKNSISIQQKINELRENYLTHHTHHFSGNLANVVIDKLYELEVEDLEKIRMVVEKRLKKLAGND